MSLLSTEGLRKEYGRLVAVESLDLEVESGEIFGFLGPNGAGKTTAISMIAGVLTPTRGRVTIAGHDLRGEPFEARRALGLVPQDVALYHELSARQNLAFFAGLYGLSGAQRDKRIDHALTLAGLVDRADDTVSDFSGGMKRRLNLAAALLHEPALLILDEPTVGVDPQSRKFLFDAIRSLAADDGVTVLYTSHYMEEVQSLCERIAIMDHGNIVATDRIEALLDAHGEPEVVVRFAGRAEAERAVAEVKSFGDARADGDSIRIQTAAKLSTVLTKLESVADVVAVRSAGADLEAVFLELTGHSLRDD